MRKEDEQAQREISEQERRQREEAAADKGAEEMRKEDEEQLRKSKRRKKEEEEGTGTERKTGSEQMSVTEEYERDRAGERVATRERLIEKYTAENRIDGETRSKVRQTLNQMIEQKYIDIAKEWYQDKEGEIRDKGYDPNTKSVPYIMDVIQRMKGFEELEKSGGDKSYQERIQEIDNFQTLEKEFKRGKVSLDGRYLALNALNGRVKGLKGEIEKAKQEKEKEIRIVKQQELKDLFETRREIAGKITGEDLVKQARREYTKDKSLKEKLFKAKKKSTIIKGMVEKKIHEIGGSIESAVGGTEAVYQRVKDGLVVEYAAKQIKEKKSPEVLKKITQEFAKKGIDPAEIMTDVLDGGNEMRNPEILKELLGDYGIKAESKEIQGLMEEMGEQGEEMNLLDWFLSLLSLLVSFLAKKVEKKS